MGELESGNRGPRFDGREAAVRPHDQVWSLSEDVPAPAIAPKIIRKQTETREQLEIEVHEGAATGFSKPGSFGRWGWNPYLKLTLESADFDVELARRIEGEFRNDIRGNIRHVESRAPGVQLGITCTNCAKGRHQTRREGDRSAARRSSDILFRTIESHRECYLVRGVEDEA